MYGNYCIASKIRIDLQVTCVRLTEVGCLRPEKLGKISY